MIEEDPKVPTALAAEKAVIYILFHWGDQLPEVMGFLKPEDFYLVRNQWIYEAVLSVFRRGEAVDYVSVVAELKRRGQWSQVSGDGYLANLEAPNIFHLATYAGLVEAAAVRRRLLEAAGNLGNLAFDGSKNTDEMLDAAEAIFRSSTKRSADRFVMRGETLVDEAYREWLDWIDDPADIRGLPTGIDGLDRILGGLTPGVYAIGGATSMGKSTLCGFITRQIASCAPGLLCPTETPGKVMLHKMAGDMAGVPFKELRSGRVANHEQIKTIDRAYTDLARVARNIRILDTSHPSLSAINAEAQRLPGCRWVVIDSGSKLAGAVKSGDERLLDAVNRVSSFSQDLSRSGLVVIVTWQFGRNAKDRAVKVPQLNDFKESGSIEEDADVCLGIYRHDYYVKRDLAKADPRVYPPGTARLLLLKDRAGANGDESITLHFKPGRGFFENVNREEP